MLDSQSNLSQDDQVDTSGRIGVHAMSALLPELEHIPGPRYRALSTAIATLLLDGRLAPGVRLPSERALAEALRLSRSTTTAAYEQLATDGLLARRRGSGSFLMLPPNARVSGPGSRMSRAGDAGDTIDLSVACLPAIPGMITEALAEITPRLSHFTAGDGYRPYGIEELRAAIAERYVRRGVPTATDNILVTNGAQHGFDLVLRLMTSPGDRVLTELPTYPGALEAIRAHGARAVAVPHASAGVWDTTLMRNSLLQTSPRVAFVIPDFHNPTGSLIGTKQRRLLAAAARRSGTVIVVDESFVDIDLRSEADRSNPPDPMAALDSSVISIGSLSKPVWGGLRIGWIRAEEDTIQRLAITRARVDMAGSIIDQLVAHRLLADLDSSIAHRREQLRVSRDTLLTELAAQLPNWRASYPLGGLSTWIELDVPAATPLTHLLEQRGVLITPGSRFGIEGTLERFLRIPFALPAADLTDAVGRIAQAWDDLDQRRVQRTSSALVPA
jgi:DNA-binding transcriptional MocR family regulator